MRNRFSREEMRMARNLLIAKWIGGIIITIVLIGFMLPSDFEVKREIVIEAPADKVFMQIRDLRKWQRWAEWFKRDPEMYVEFRGATGKVGMKSMWYSDQETNGEMTIITMVENVSLTYELYFPDMDIVSTGEFKLEGNGEQTRVVWRDYGSFTNPLLRYMSLIKDPMIGNDFEAGLANLKAYVEQED